MSSSSSSRLLSLDSLRGIAAFIVLLDHCVHSLPDLEDKRILVHLANGSASVLIFFVLSGMVLTMTCTRRDPDKYIPFIVKRIFRIWPPFALAVLVAAVARLSLGHHNVVGTTATFMQNSASSITMRSLLEHLMMVGTALDLDPPMWSLIHEMRISLIFPPLVFLSLPRWRSALSSTFLVTIVAEYLHSHNPALQSLIMTIRFSFLFILGILIAEQRDALRGYFLSIGEPLRLAFLTACVGIVFTSPDFSGKWNHTTDIRFFFVD